MSININDKLKGHVKWYNQEKKIGLIELEDGGINYSVRHADILTVDKSLDENDYVSFVGEIIDGTLTATNITLL